MQIKQNEIHVWSVDLKTTPEWVNKEIDLLSADELKRAQRYRFEIHQKRFIAARSRLRQILSWYLDMLPHTITFTYTDHKKPFLSHPAHTRLMFNISHSEDIAVLALTLDYAIGIDIEKTKSTYNEAVAKRFFSPTEYAELMHLEEEKRAPAFYCLWARKEAIVKATGRGLSIPLSSFSVSINDIEEKIVLENEIWSLVPLLLYDDYQSALATNQSIKKIHLLNFFDHGRNYSNK